MHQHRHFAHLVDAVAVFRLALDTGAEEIDPNRLPVGADQIEHQRGAIGIAGLGEAIELIFGHERILICRSDLARQRYRRAGGGLAFEAAAGEIETRQRIVLVIVDHQRVLLEQPSAGS